MNDASIPASGDAIAALASAAGLQVDWTDAAGRPRRVTDAVLVRLLDALGLPARSEAECAESARRLAEERQARQSGPLVIGIVDEPIRVASSAHGSSGAPPIPVQITLEGGPTIDALARVDEGGFWIPGIRTHGYHKLVCGTLELTLAVAPQRCFGIEDLFPPGAESPRLWGLASQIYALRRTQPTGMGDFSALADLCIRAGAAGASAVGINPVHANFTADATRYSPYAPSSRLFLNPLYVDPVPVFGAAALSQAVAATLGNEAWLALDQAPLIDWSAVGPARLAVLRHLFERRETLLNSERLADLRAFCAAADQALLDHARFEVLDAEQRRQGVTCWQDWPPALRDARSAEVSAFDSTHRNDILFQLFLQWLAQRALACVQDAARKANMAIGLINDLAVGTDPAGSHAWSRRDEILQDLVCGAPPDLYNPAGQTWGLSAFSPEALQRTGYRAFIEMLRATLAQCGGLRIDHVLGMMRLWLVPTGHSAADGAYLRYPFDDMLRLVALESWRNRAIIIGENLGTVPEGFNDRLAASGILGTTVLWFESENNWHGGWGSLPRRFKGPAEWPAASVATTSTHDLPTSSGWWRGNDIEWRARLGLLDVNDSAAAQHDLRQVERQALAEAMRGVGLLHGDTPPADAPPLAELMAFVARTAAPLVLFPLEDLLGEVEQPNVPGTTSGHPNWQRRFPYPLATRWDDVEVSARRAAIAAGRLSSRSSP